MNKLSNNMCPTCKQILVVQSDDNGKWGIYCPKCHVKYGQSWHSKNVACNVLENGCPSIQDIEEDRKCANSPNTRLIID